tara:strand:+ start:3079 stop:3555 length:477 start_codon:yes stop_codon:yes gene_type:complete
MLRSDAVFSDCRKYRFALWRVWDEALPSVMFIGLNPSTADESANDPTLTRCIRYAQSWGYGGVCMANIFAFRATDPKVMMSVPDPVGADNDRWLLELSQSAGLVVAAWGNTGRYMGRSDHVRNLIPNLHCLKLNKSGEPAHPLYQKTQIQPTLMILTS